jgi:Phage T7 capsid assembly protein
MNEGQVVITSPETGAIAPEPTNPQSVAPSDNTTERPAWLPEKFQSTEELAKAYAELESKLGNRGQAEEKIQESLPNEQLPPDFSKFGSEYMQNGRLSDQSYEELASRGIPREVVDAYISGQQAVQEREVNTVMTDIGGKENFDALSKWAASNLSQDELDAYNAMVMGGNLQQARMAVKGLYAQYLSGNSEPSLLGGNTGRYSGDGFRSTAEVIQAMKDPRYQNDEAYRKDVQNRLSVSEII